VDTLAVMVHLRIVVPSDRSKKVLGLLAADFGASVHLQRRIYERRRLRHLGGGARAAAGLPADRRGEPSRG
jgi:hypothetical protein